MPHHRLGGGVHRGDDLLERGYSNLTVLDISSKAIISAKTPRTAGRLCDLD